MLEDSPVVLAGVGVQMTEVVTKLSAGEEIEAPEVILGEVAGT